MFPHGHTLILSNIRPNISNLAFAFYWESGNLYTTSTHCQNPFFSSYFPRLGLFILVYRLPSEYIPFRLIKNNSKQIT